MAVGVHLFHFYISFGLLLFTFAIMILIVFRYHRGGGAGGVSSSSGAASFYSGNSGKTKSKKQKKQKKKASDSVYNVATLNLPSSVVNASSSSSSNLVAADLVDLEAGVSGSGLANAAGSSDTMMSNGKKGLTISIPPLNVPPPPSVPPPPPPVSLSGVQVNSGGAPPPPPPPPPPPAAPAAPKVVGSSSVPPPPPPPPPAAPAPITSKSSTMTKSTVTTTVSVSSIPPPPPPPPPPPASTPATAPAPAPLQTRTTLNKIPSMKPAASAPAFSFNNRSQTMNPQQSRSKAAIMAQLQSAPAVQDLSKRLSLRPLPQPKVDDASSIFSSRAVDNGHSEGPEEEINCVATFDDSSDEEGGF